MTTTKRISSSSTPLPLPPRCERWQAPTGRYLERGQTFQVKGEGWFKFLAFVEAPAQPYVECVSAAPKGVKSIRCIRPERIARTSKKVVR